MFQLYVLVALYCHRASAALCVQQHDSKQVSMIANTCVQAFAAMTAAHGRHADAEPRRTLQLHFLKSPVRLDAASNLSDSTASTLRVGSMTLQHNTLERDDRGQQRAVAAPNIPRETLPADLVITSVGYRAVPLAGVAFDAARGTVPHIMGRVVREAGSTELVPGLYVSGWLKRGAQGIIGTNLVDSHETAMAVAEDFAPGMPLAVASSGVAGPPHVGALLKVRHHRSLADSFGRFMWLALTCSAAAALCIDWSLVLRRSRIAPSKRERLEKLSECMSASGTRCGGCALAGLASARCGRSCKRLGGKQASGQAHLLGHSAASLPSSMIIDFHFVPAVHLRRCIGVVSFKVLPSQMKDT